MAITFTSADHLWTETLTDLALKSNAYWGYRNISDEKAREILGVQSIDFDPELSSLRIMKEADKIIGFFGLRASDDQQELYHFFLSPQYIHKGYGRLLWNEAVRVAINERQWKTLEFDSDPFAANFYEHMGAFQIGEKPCPLHDESNPEIQLKTPRFKYILIE